MKSKVFGFLMLHDVITQLVMLGIVSLMMWLVKAKDWVYSMNVMIVCVLNYSGSSGMSFINYNKYMNFGFCRKHFYWQQVSLTFIRSGTYALVQTVIHIIHEDSYIVALIQDTSYTADMYGQMPVVKIFLFYFSVLVCLNLIMLVTVPCRIYPFVRVEGTLQLNYRRQLAKSTNPVGWKVGVALVKICGLAVMCVCCGMFGLAGCMYQINSAFWLGSVSVCFLISTITVLVGRKTFRPENI